LTPARPISTPLGGDMGFVVNKKGTEELI